MVDYLFMLAFQMIDFFQKCLQDTRNFLLVKFLHLILDLNCSFLKLSFLYFMHFADLVCEKASLGFELLEVVC